MAADNPSAGVSSPASPSSKWAPPIRLDEWAAVSEAPTAVPFETRPRGLVFRGMRDFTAACRYARHVQCFFAQHGDDSTVFVVRGPTSTTREPFEVVDASCGYTIAYRAEPLVDPVSEHGGTEPLERERARA